ncbi:uncharacterized GPI-anchored protein At5g19250-like [Rhododendron vialii]|uniref:uncharacterized GPI-anchored protein At5g19250-like n=1 Tax=Rhododendron vialii TaxID=182163 RepID=UPI00265F56B8|nr:uncharacterized GPI-anchored protein At5g19250-like [Rhododendron vialii]XP_058197878.1 uncharacterized GPI-anchored protein At5g19250-like [Rhododendron vialii]
MGFLYRLHLLLLVLLHAILLLPNQVQSQDASLLQGLNSYRASLSLSTLTDSSNADCFAKQVATQFKGQPCSNTTGADTIPGTEAQFANYPDLLTGCHLNITDTKDGQIMPVCVPNLVPSLVLTNYTETQYNQYLNESSFTGAGIGSYGNWIVVVLSTNTVGGDFATAENSKASLFSIIGLAQNLFPWLLGFILYL